MCEHDALEHPAVPSTCTQQGNSLYYSCDKCGLFFADAECAVVINEGTWVLDYAAHSYEYVPEIPATCIETGREGGYMCSVCGQWQVFPGSIPVISHNYVVLPAVEPTCTTPGSTLGVQCSMCLSYLVVPSQLTALGHEPTDMPCVEPGCGNEGTTGGLMCSRCGEIIVEPEAVPVLNVHYIRDGICTACGRDFSHSSEKLLKLPSRLKIIESESFVGLAADAVLLPAVITSVDERAFSGFDNLKLVYAPEQISEFVKQQLSEISGYTIVYFAGTAVENRIG